MRQLCNVTVLLLLFGLTSCQNNGDKQTTMSPVKVKVLRVFSSEIDGTERFSGTVEEANSTSLSFSIMGTVKTVHVGLGDRVAKGQLIATVDPLSMQSSYDAAKASLEQAEDAYRRMKELYDKGSLPEIKWVEMQSKLQQAKSMEEVARKNLDDCKGRAEYNAGLTGGQISDSQSAESEDCRSGDRDCRHCHGTKSNDYRLCLERAYLRGNSNRERNCSQSAFTLIRCQDTGG